MRTSNLRSTIVHESGKHAIQDTVSYSKDHCRYGHTIRRIDNKTHNTMCCRAAKCELTAPVQVMSGRHRVSERRRMGIPLCAAVVLLVMHGHPARRCPVARLAGGA